jgi:hypothetical protein
MSGEDLAYLGWGEQEGGTFWGRETNDVQETAGLSADNGL